MAGCCSVTSVLIKTSAFLYFLGLVLLVLGLGTPFWSSRPGESEGLWEKCFGAACYPSREDTISDEGWYIVTQVMVTVGLFCATVGVVLTFITMFSESCAGRMAIRIAALVKAFSAAALVLAAATSYWIGGSTYFTIFNLGFSWGITVAAAAVFFIVGIVLAVDIGCLCKNGDATSDA